MARKAIQYAPLPESRIPTVRQAAILHVPQKNGTAQLQVTERSDGLRVTLTDPSGIERHADLHLSEGRALIQEVIRVCNRVERRPLNVP